MRTLDWRTPHFPGQFLHLDTVGMFAMTTDRGKVLDRPRVSFSSRIYAPFGMKGVGGYMHRMGHLESQKDSGDGKPPALIIYLLLRGWRGLGGIAQVFLLVA